MSDDIWILGINMTKFGKHPDKDTVDLAVRGRDGRAGRRRRDDERHGRAGRRQPDEANAGIGQQLQKQIGQTGIPVYNVANACATGATALRTAIMAVKAGRVRHGPRRRRREAGRRRPARAAAAARRATRTTWTPSGRYGAVTTHRRPHRHRRDAGRVRPGRHGVRPQVRRHQLRAVRQDQREEPRPLDAQPAGRVHRSGSRSTRS